MNRNLRQTVILYDFAALAFLAMIGCDLLISDPPTVDDYIPTLAVAIGITADGQPVPVPDVTPDGNICEACDGKGWNGDMAVKIPCEACGGTGRITSQPIQADLPFVIPEITIAQEVNSSAALPLVRNAATEPAADLTPSIGWRAFTDLKLLDLQREALESGKPLYIHLTFPESQCQQCAKENKVLADPEVAEWVNEYTTPVKVDLSEHPEFCELWGSTIIGAPQDWVVQPAGGVYQAAGLQTKASFLATLRKYVERSTLVDEEKL
jgi:hypothetical protein